MKIAFFETKNWEKPYLKKRLKEHTLKFYEEPLTTENAKEVADFDIISTFIYSKINKEVLQLLPNLKLIATRSTGFDHIDTEECKKKGIVVCNVPHYGENTVAEFTFGLILALARKIHKAYERTKQGKYDIEGLKGFDLKGKTIGVIGTGHIGLHVIKIAKGFGMNVLAYSRHWKKLLAEVLGFKYVPLEELLKKSDIITLHVPYTKSTYHLINKENIKLIKKGAILINTSRGPVVDTEALIEALREGRLAGVALDVIEGEELIKDEKEFLYKRKKFEDLVDFIKSHVLLSYDNVLFTPHIAFYTQEALERILETTVENIEAFIKGKPQNVCNPL